MSDWIDQSIAEIEKNFVKNELKAVLNSVSLDGSLVDHMEGRLISTGNAMQCAWMIINEGRIRESQKLTQIGL